MKDMWTGGVTEWEPIVVDSKAPKKEKIVRKGNQQPKNQDNIGGSSKTASVKGKGKIGETPCPSDGNAGGRSVRIDAEALVRQINAINDAHTAKINAINDAHTAQIKETFSIEKSLLKDELLDGKEPTPQRSTEHPTPPDGKTPGEKDDLNTPAWEAYPDVSGVIKNLNLSVKKPHPGVQDVSIHLHT